MVRFDVEFRIVCNCSKKFGTELMAISFSVTFKPTGKNALTKSNQFKYGYVVCSNLMVYGLYSAVALRRSSRGSEICRNNRIIKFYL